MKNKYNDTDKEKEINSFIDLVLHLDSFLFKGQADLDNLNKKISNLNLSNNSIEIIQEIIASENNSYYLCYDDKIKEIRNNQGIMKAIKQVFKQEQEKAEEKQEIRKINAYGFNQLGLSNNKAFYSNEAEFFFLKNFIHSKILNIIKSCFEKEYNKKLNMNHNNRYLKNKTNFILISHSCLRNAKLLNEYIKNNQNLSLSNYYIKLTNSKLLNPINFKYLKRSLNRSQINIYDTNSNSKVFNLYKNPKNTSYVNSSDFNMNKNSSSSCDKSSNKIIDFNTINISNNNKNNLFTKKNIHLLNKRKSEAKDKSYFLPLLNIKDNNYKKKPKLRGKQIPSFNSEKMELISYNTKNNIKVKNEQTFLDECIKESYRSLRNINNMNESHQSKCFVDYSKSSIMSDKMSVKKNVEAPPKEKIFYPGFEYKSIYKYTFNGKLRQKKNIIVYNNRNKS